MGSDGASQAAMAFCPEAGSVISCGLIVAAKAVKRCRAKRLLESLE
jgi:hypothetical protein